MFAAAVSTLTWMMYLMAFASVMVFAYVGLRLFGKGWTVYEQRYMEGARRSLDSLYLSLTPHHILYLSLLSFFAGAILVGAFTMNVVGGILGGIPFFIAPCVLLRFLQRRRAKRFERQLAEAIGSIASGLEAGTSLLGAIQAYHTEAHPPAKIEFGILLHEVRLGVPIKKALHNLLTRMPSENLDLIITAMAIGESIGGNLVRVLKNMEETIRERQRLDVKLDALTAEGKMEGMILGSAPVVLGLLIALVNPALMRPMYQSLLGWAMVGAVAVMLGLGFFWIKRIVRIDF